MRYRELSCSISTLRLKYTISTLYKYTMTNTTFCVATLILRIPIVILQYLHLKLYQIKDAYIIINIFKVI